eukprot:COSAG01_NODE_29693_length_632_cov_0.756098_1_plen_59_part_10
MLPIAFIMFAIVVAAFVTRRLCVQKTERPHAALDAHFFKQKTAYEIMSGDWSSDVCSSD